MPKLTLQQRPVDAFITTGRGATVASHSREHITRPDGTFFFVGPAGALRYGNTLGSIAASDEFRRRMT